jgi:hypothetical protein
LQAEARYHPGALQCVLKWRRLLPRRLSEALTTQSVVKWSSYYSVRTEVEGSYYGTCCK